MQLSCHCLAVDTSSYATQYLVMTTWPRLLLYYRTLAESLVQRFSRQTIAAGWWLLCGRAIHRTDHGVDQLDYRSVVIVCCAGSV